MEDLRNKVNEKISLLEQLTELKAEEQRLAKELTELETLVAQEQADVDKLTGFSLKGLALQLRGRKEEVLEQEQREARYAKSNFDHADLRLQGVRQQRKEIAFRLDELVDCEKELHQAITEKMRKDPFPEETAAIENLERVLVDAKQLRTMLPDVRREVDAYYTELGDLRKDIWSMMRRDKAAEVAQEALDPFVKLACDIGPRLNKLGYPAGLSRFAEFDSQYLTDALFGRSDRALTVLDELRIANINLDRVIPKMELQLQKMKLEFMRMLVDASISYI